MDGRGRRIVSGRGAIVHRAWEHGSGRRRSATSTCYRALPIELLLGTTECHAPADRRRRAVAGRRVRREHAAKSARMPRRPPQSQPRSRPVSRPWSQPPEPEARVDPTVVAQGFTADAEYRLGELCGGHRESQLDVGASIRRRQHHVPRRRGNGAHDRNADPSPGCFRRARRPSPAKPSEPGAPRRWRLRSRTSTAYPGRDALEPGGAGQYELRRRSDRAAVRPAAITTTGLVVSRFESEQINVPIYAVYYDAAGEVVGGAVTICRSGASRASRPPFEASTRRHRPRHRGDSRLRPHRIRELTATPLHRQVASVSDRA